MKGHLSRRQFLTVAGAAGLAFGPGQVAADALRTRPASGGVLPRPAWVRTVDRPTLWLDEATYGRFDKRRCVFPTRSGGSLATYVGADGEQALLQASAEASGRLAARPGYRPRDRALVAALSSVSTTLAGPNSPNRGLLSWRGLPASGREEAVPEVPWLDAVSATADVKVAARFFGAALAGVCALDERHLYSHDLDGKAIVLAQAQAPEETTERRVIPSRCRHVVVVAVRMSAETVKRAPTALVNAATYLAYVQLQQLVAALAQFIRAMGYTAVPSVNDTAPTIPLAVAAGLGELGRHNRLITPEYGPMVRLGKVFTDAPLLVDGPIEAGIPAFCRTCAKCAEACPSGALSYAEEPSFAVEGPWNNPGHLAWHEDAVKCFSYNNSIASNCMICFSVCPFSKKSRAAVHGLVKSTISRTDLANGVLRSVDDAFGYGGQKSPDGWWQLDLPPGGLD